MIKIFFIDISNRNPFYSVFPETSLLQVVELFGSGTHRGISNSFFFVKIC